MPAVSRFSLFFHTKTIPKSSRCIQILPQRIERTAESRDNVPSAFLFHLSWFDDLRTRNHGYRTIVLSVFEIFYLPFLSRAMSSLLQKAPQPLFLPISSENLPAR